MDERVKAMDKKVNRATNLTLRRTFVQEARSLGVNLSRSAEEGIERAVAKDLNDQWLARNRGKRGKTPGNLGPLTD